MAPTYNFLLFFFLFFIVSPSIATKSFRPKRLVLPVSKDASTGQYLTQISQRTPLVPVKLTLDLGGKFLWVDCETDYVSSSKKPVPCGSSQCKLSGSGSCSAPCYDPVLGTKPGCKEVSVCGHLPSNTITQVGTSGDLYQDIVSIQSTDGSSPGRAVSVPKLIFLCSASFLLDGLASGVKGMAGLGWDPVSLPTQFSTALSFKRKFAICLSSAKGVVFFGNGPYVLLPNVDVSKSLIYTPLIRNKVNLETHFEGEASTEYFIGVKSIQINGKAVPLNKTLLSVNKEGHGGTKISTVSPFTVMETSIYNSVTNAFIKELSHVPRVAPVAPFGACFDSTKIGSTRVGPAVPAIDLVLQSSSVYWRIFGANSMVQVKNGVMCLGFVDGGAETITSIVIGGHQLEDNLLQFDLANSKLGFSSSLLFRQTTCANFNFTSDA